MFKGNGMSCLEFEAKWEEKTTALIECGLAKNETEMFYQYLEKVGPKNSELIRLDRRQRPNADGSGSSMRPPRTWEEAHAVMVEREKIDKGTKAMSMGMSTVAKMNHPFQKEFDELSDAAPFHSKGGGKGGKG